MKKLPQSRIITYCLLVMTGFTGLSLRSQTYYSSFASPGSGTHYTYATGGACIGCAVNNPSNAASLSLTDSTHIYMTVGLANTISVNLKLTDTAKDIVGVLIRSNTGLLNASALNAVEIKTYYGGVLKETFSGSGILGLSLFGTNMQKIQAPVTEKFNEVKLSINNAISAIWDVNIFYAYGLSLVPLQVQPVTFQARVVNNSSIRLDWHISGEQLYKRFHIMHSANGKTYSELDCIVPGTNRSQVDAFSYIHERVQPGQHYYYLELECMDGNTTATEIIYRSLSIPGRNDRLVRVFPNPAMQYIFVDLPEEAGSLKIFNVLGELVSEQACDEHTTAMVRLEHLQAGTYYVLVEMVSGITEKVLFIKD